MTEQVQGEQPAESQQVVTGQPELSLADLEKQIAELSKEKSEVKSEVQEKAAEPKPEEPKVEVGQPTTVVGETKPVPESSLDGLSVKATPPPRQQGTPTNPMEEFNQWAKENMQVDPVGTIATINRLMNRPMEEVQRKNLLREETIKLSTSPETSDFNNKDIQAEIIKIVAESPTRWTDELGWVRPEYLKDIYYMAKGRKNIVPQVKNVVENPVPVEGRSKVAASPTVDFNKLSLEQMEDYLRKQK